MSVGIELVVTLPRDVGSVALVRHVLKHALEDMHVVEPCIADIELAVTEACANVVEHAESDDEYEIRACVDDGRCEILVLDRYGVVPRLPDELPALESEGGRGLMLMGALMDSLAFEAVEPHGTALRLVKRLTFDAPPLGASWATFS